MHLILSSCCPVLAFTSHSITCAGDLPPQYVSFVKSGLCYAITELFEQIQNLEQSKQWLVPEVQSSTFATCAGYLLAARQLRDALMYDEWIKGPLGMCCVMQVVSFY